MAKPRGRRIKRVALGLLCLGLVVVTVLAIVGVPAPPSATVSGVPRVSWRSVVLAGPVALNMLGQTRLVAWDPAGGLFVTGYDGLSPRIHHVAQPGASVEPTELPEHAGGLSPNPDPARRYAVFTLDEGGNESRRLYRWDFETSTATALTEAGTKIWLGPWSRDGSRVAYATQGATDGDRDLYVMDPSAPDSARLVYSGSGSWSVSDWSADGHRLLVSEYRSIVDTRPHVLEIDSGRIRPLLEPEPPSRFFGLRFTAEEDEVLFLSNRDAEFTRLRRVNLSTGDVRDVGPEVPWDVDRIAASHDRTRFAIGINEDGVVRWYLLDPSTGGTSPLPTPDGALVVRVRFHPQRAALAVTLTDRFGSTSVGVLNLDDGGFESWTAVPDLDEPALPAARLVRYPTFDRDGDGPRRIPAFVFDPPRDAPRPAPVVVRIHGGPEGQSRGYPNPLYDALRRELGVAVITPNVRGSTGYGKTYVGLDDGRRREDAVRDIGSLLDWIATQPQLDHDRVIVYGGSYGGYMVLASLVHFPDAIRCGVDIVGISNFVSFLENTKPYRRQLRRAEYGDERDPDMRAFLESISPLSRADEIRADLLVIQGANDPRVPASESRRIVERLRTLGREVWYLEFDDEGHGLRMPLNVAYAAAVGYEFARRCLEP